MFVSIFLIVMQQFYYVNTICIIMYICYLYLCTVQVKNKMPAPVQITAEQLLREAKERELELVQPVL